MANAINSLNFGNNIYTFTLPYGVCDTAAGTATKVVTVDNFSLETGAVVIVKFANANTASSPKLNVNGTGAKAIMRYGTTAASTSSGSSGWYAGAVSIFVYDGTNWIRDYWYNSTYSNAALGQGYATCSTAEATVAKTATLSSYSISTGGIVAVKFTYAVPASATLNVNSKGAKNIFYRGAAITAGIIKAGDIATFIYDGTQYQLISIDRWQVDLDNKMAKSNPSGTGQFSMNRLSGSTVGLYSSTLGYNNTASGVISHAQGTGNTASGDWSSAEGNTTTASGNSSHAEGDETTASGMGAHAEGYLTEASGGYSHAEGCNTIASGEYAHAEGAATEASGYYSHAEGRQTVANSISQHVQGDYNILDTENIDDRGTYAHIVGNGTSSARSNAHTLDWSGNAWFAGDVYVGSTSGTNKDGGSVKLSKEGHNHSASNITSGTLAVGRGGTGITSNPSMLTNLGSTSAASVFAASPRPGVTGTLPLANGGTGATTAAAARTNLSVYSKAEVDSAIANSANSSDAFVSKSGDVMTGSLVVKDNFNVNKTFDSIEYKTYVRPINYSIGNNGDYSTGLIHYKGDANQAQLMFNKDGVMLRDNVNSKAYQLFGQHNAATAATSIRSQLYTYGTNDLTAGVSELETGKLYFVYE